MNIAQLSSRPVIRAPRSCGLREAAILMRQHHVGALVVTGDAPDDGEVVGIVTDRDLVLKALAQGIGPDEAELADVMSDDFATIEQSADVQAALAVMRENGVRRLGVVDEDGSVVGFVAFDDLVTGFAAAFAGLAHVIETEREREVDENEDAEEPIDVTED